MSTKTSTQYDWMKAIPSSLLKLDNTPLFGNAPAFDWNQFSQSIKSLFQLNECVIESFPPEWRDQETISKGINKNTIPLQFSFSSLDGTGFWLMEKNDLSVLMSLLLKEKESITETLDTNFLQAFHDFLGHQVLRTFLEVRSDKALSPQIISTNEFPNESSLCIDIQYQINGKRFSGKLILPPAFQQSLKHHYLEKEAKSSAVNEKVNIIVSLEGGRTTLTKKEWKSVKTGDFILLDSCTVDPDLGKGRVLMTVHGIVLYRAMVKNGNIKILESPLYHEVTDTMENNMAVDDEFNESEFEESEFEESEFEESEFEESEFEESEFEESEYEEEDEYGEEELKELGHAIPEKKIEKSATKEVASGVETAKAPERKGIGDPSEIPLTIIVEIGRLQMSIKQLGELQPGNLLELDIKPEDGVDLIVNGRKIAKAELIKVGDALGVRILEM